MNCEQIRNQILLSMSGELSDTDLIAVNNHIDECDLCKEYRDDSILINHYAQSELGSGNPTERTISNIIRAGSEKQPHKLIIFPTYRILAVAATLALLVCGWMMLYPSGSINRDNHDMSIILSMVNNEAYNEQDVSKQSQDKKLQTLAEQILKMEGLSDNGDMIDFFTDPQEDSPTALQLRNTPDVRAEKCV